MSADTAVLAGGEREPMNTTTRNLGRRLGTLGLALLLALALAGDRGRAATVPAAVYGQDPLEILELKVRPNVVIVLDSSGSMLWTTTGAPALAGAITRVEDVPGEGRPGPGHRGQPGQGQLHDEPVPASGQRLRLGLRGRRGPPLPVHGTTAAPIMRARGDTAGPGLPVLAGHPAGFNRIHSRGEPGHAGRLLRGRPGPVLPEGRGPGGRPHDGHERRELQPVPRRHPEHLHRHVRPRQRDLRFGSDSIATSRCCGARATNSIRGALGVTWGDTGSGGGPYQSGTPYSLLYEHRARNLAGDRRRMGMTSSSQPDASVTYNQAGAARLWNGETLQVQADGTICGLTPPPSPAPPSSPCRRWTRAASPTRPRRP